MNPIIRILCTYVSLWAAGSSGKFSKIYIFSPKLSPDGNPVCPTDQPSITVNDISAITACSLECMSEPGCQMFAYKSTSEECLLYRGSTVNYASSDETTCQSFQVRMLRFATMYIPCSLSLRLLGPFGVLWVHMAWHENCVKKLLIVRIMSAYAFIRRNYLNFHEKTDLESQSFQRIKSSFLASHAF